MASSPLIISAAVNGADLTPTDTPHVPLTPVEIAQSTIEACRAGAAIAHVHVRATDGTPSDDVAIFRDVLRRVRAECDVLLNFSTDLRLPSGTDCLAAGPELASLPVGSVNLGESVMSAPVPVVRAVAEQMRALGVRPELEIFHEGMIGTARKLVADGVVKEPVFCQFCLGYDGGAPADPAVLLRLVDAIPPEWIWSAVGDGAPGVSIAALAIGLGGHVRVGIEDHPYYLPGELSASNAQLVARAARLAHEFGREIASPAEARAILGL